ncbi:hypothetical protein ACIBTV_24420 [Micromonospora sp. NPDC049366]|uniref:hypothetical protein n=1 Tax=Micromonospora sp. NPDC049366 TaxID=3364271 RepID=UPI0037B88EA3
MFNVFNTQRRIRHANDTHNDQRHVQTPDESALASKSRIREALDEIDRHLASGAPTRDALLDVRLKLSPTAPLSPRASHYCSDCGWAGLMGALLFVGIGDYLEDTQDDDEDPGPW